MRSIGRHWHLAMSKLMSLRWEWSESTPYGATNGSVLLLNPKGIEQLAARPDGAGLIAFLLVHESLHALLGHGWRLAEMRDPATANVAADYVVNAMIDLRNKELGRVVFPFIDGVLLDHALSGDNSVEQLYRKLIKPQPQQPEINPKPSPTTNEKQDKENSEGQPEEDPAPAGGDQDSLDGGDPGDDDGDGDSELGDDGSGRAGTEPGDRDDEGGGDGGSGGGDAEGDGPPDGDSSPSVEEPGDLKDFPGTGAVDNRAPEPEEDETYKEAVDRVEEVNDRIIVADSIDRASMKDTGSTGKRVADQRASGYSLGWADLLREWLCHHSRDGWDNPFNSAIFSSTGLICSGRRKKAAGVVVWVLDTSGSIGQETYSKFLGEAREALEMLKPEAMHLLSVSHQVCDSVSLEPGDRVPDTLKGGGGTRFQPAFDWVVENDIEPDVLVYLTDGDAYDLSSLTVPDYPVLWLSTGKERKDYPFGDVVMVDGL
jgi:predicted metal-dependent peptidase